MNILIVDDDRLIRNWLSLLLRQVPGYDVHLLEATDGLDALEICEEKPIDLVITDIKMPRMDGIELIGTLKAEYPHIRTSVLSSYDDFDYVRVALKCGALDYIRKAEMKMEDIAALLEKTTRDIEMEKGRKNGSGPPALALAQLKQHFLEFYEGTGTDSNAYLATLSPPLQLEHLCITLVRADVAERGELPAYMAASICEETLSAAGMQGIAFPWAGDLFCLLYNQPQGGSKKEGYQALAALLDKNMEKYTGVPVRHSINLLCREGDDLRARFREALDIMELREYYGTDVPLRIATEGPSHRKSLVLALQRCVDIKDYTGATGVLCQSLATAHEARIAPRRARHLAVSGMNVLLTCAALLEHQPAALDQLASCIEEATAARTMQRTAASVEQFCTGFLSLTGEGPHSLSPAVRSAVEYIGKNYAEKLSLEDVAAHVHLNRSYLSQLFKKEMHLPFGDYLEQVRISHAKQLIRGSAKSMQEVAECTGFSNQNYFTKVFKAATGVSPLKYKKQ